MAIVLLSASVGGQHDMYLKNKSWIEASAEA